MDSEKDSQDTPVPFQNSYWVIPGKILAGEYPDEYDEHGTHRKVAGMLQLGIQVFIDLTNPRDIQETYHRILRDEAFDLGVDVDIITHEIDDFGVPQPLEMTMILDEIDRAVADEKPVYVHCLAGLGRTGTVVGCYLVRHGEEGQDALLRLGDLRKNTLTAHMPSPESREQEMFILGWRKGQ